MNNGFILNSDQLDEFEKEIALISGLMSQDTDESYPRSTVDDNGQLSASEERAWLLHQQNPLSASGPFTAAFKLTGKLDKDQLISALTSLYQNDSALNQVYKLQSDGTLVKEHHADLDIRIKVIPDKTDEEIIDHLLQSQSVPIDLATQTALQFYLFTQSESENVLGLLGHHILIDDSAWQPIFHAISASYNGQDSVSDRAENKTSVASTLPIKTTEHYWTETYPNGLNRTALPGIMLKPAAQSAEIQNINSQRLSQQSTQANRFYSYISDQKITQLANQAQASSFQTLLSLFGLFLQQILNKESVDILVPVVTAGETLQLNQIKSSSNVIPVSIRSHEQSFKSATIRLRNDFLTGLTHNLPIEQIFSITGTQRTAHPNILVTQIDDATGYLQLEGIRATSLAVPPLSSDYDLTLAFQHESDGQIRFELTTGEQLSTTIGAFLLERFILFIEETNADHIARIPSFVTTDTQADETNIPEEVSIASWTNATQRDPHEQAKIDSILTTFKSILNLQDISAEDDFFELGGHSLLATRVIGQLKNQHHIEVRIADFFNSPTAHGLAEFAHYSDEALTKIAVADEEEEIIAPHSYVQLTYMPLIEGGRNPIFNIPFTLKFSQPVNEQAFHRAFIDTLIRHHTLRTLLRVRDGEEPQQRVIPASTLDDYDWFLSSAQQGEVSAEQILAEEANYRFDLVHELPIRVRFVYNDLGEHFLSLLIYHTAFDEWSTSVLIRDLFYAYREYLAGREPSWESYPAQYHQYVIEQRKTLDIDKKLAYWQQVLGQVEPIKPLFYSENQTITPSAEGNWIEFSFNNTIADRLKQLAHINKSSMFHVVYATFSLALYYLGAGKQQLIATSAYGRDDPRYQDTVGLFTNVILNHVHFDETQRVNELISQIRENIIASLPYSDVPFVTVEQAVAARPLASPIDNLCEVYIQYHQKNELNSYLELDEGETIDFELLEPERNIAKFGLHFEAYEDPSSEDQRFRVVLAYRTSHYSTDQIQLIRATTEAVVLALTNTDNQGDKSLREIRKILAGSLVK